MSLFDIVSGGMGLFSTISGTQGAAAASRSEQRYLKEASRTASALRTHSIARFNHWASNIRPTEQAWAATSRSAARSAAADVGMRNRLRPQVEQYLRETIRTENAGLRAERSDRKHYERFVRPKERKMLKAATIDEERAASRAGADYDEAEDRARTATRQAIEMRGGDPSSGRWQTSMARSFAGERAAGVTDARFRERHEGVGRMATAINAYGRDRGISTAGLGRSRYLPANPMSGPTRSSGGDGSAGLGAAAREYSALGGAYNQQAVQQAESAGSGFEAMGPLLNMAGMAMGLPFAEGGYIDGDTGAYVEGYATGGYIDADPREGYEGQPAGGNNPRMPRGYADGGMVEGPGDGTSDSVPAEIVRPDGEAQPAALSNGEFVMTAKEVEGIVRDFISRGSGAGLQRRSLVA